MPFSTFNNFMDKTKQNKTLVSDHESDVIKSAAWAWYQHGYDHPNGRSSVREYDVLRHKFEPKPSRYKLEASRNVQESILESRRTISSPRCTIRRASNSLLDNYEIERISKQLDYYIESSHAMYSGGSPGGMAEEMAAEVKSKGVQKKKVGKGFWLRSHAPLCGSSRDDVVEGKSVEYLRRSRPGKAGVAVVEVVGCRPLPWRIRV
ncbi:uncharacterized protein LOC110012462 [Sesamum indicum]|uniref:Uncharacterized protein LOC110012462 n=1 Tax=Sesamum indicum TaxID=4182 RepID=A0A8M8V697_SESIN|nr:uncharacterized protein LOC110012462 [Sesamum indicum]